MARKGDGGGLAGEDVHKIRTRCPFLFLFFFGTGKRCIPREWTIMHCREYVLNVHQPKAMEGKKKERKESDPGCMSRPIGAWKGPDCLLTHSTWSMGPCCIILPCDKCNSPLAQSSQFYEIMKCRTNIAWRSQRDTVDLCPQLWMVGVP